MCDVIELHPDFELLTGGQRRYGLVSRIMREVEKAIGVLLRRAVRCDVDQPGA